MRAIVLAAVVFCSGCLTEMPTAKHRAHTVGATGRRVLVTNAEGKIVGKVRLRSTGVRVYGDDLVPIGTVSSSDGIAFHPFPEGAKQTLAKTEADVWEFDQSMRIERTQSDWALFDANAQLLGYLNHDGGWSFRGAAGDTWTVNEGKVLDQGKVRCEARSTGSSEMLLALCVDALPVQARVALALWMQTQVTPG
ncbi:MAG: hypothetical protein R3E66_08380 [bacterium]